MAVLLTMQDKQRFERVGEIFGAYRQSLIPHYPNPQVRDAVALTLTQCFFQTELAEKMAAAADKKLNHHGGGN